MEWLRKIVGCLGEGFIMVRDVLCEMLWYWNKRGIPLRQSENEKNDRQLWIYKGLYENENKVRKDQHINSCFLFLGHLTMVFSPLNK